MEMNTKNVLFFLIFLIILILIAIAITAIGPTNQPQNEPGDRNITIESRFPGKIVYTTDVDQDLRPFQDDCLARNGEFNTCGNICAPDAEVCAEVCAFTCEFEEPAEVSAPEGWQEFRSQEIGFSIWHPQNMDVEKREGSPAAIGEVVTISMWGPTQERDTEFFDGISLTFQKESGEDISANTGPREYAQVMRARQSDDPITDNITSVEEVKINNITGYQYTVTSIGEYTNIFLPHEEENMILHVIYSAPDPTNQGFQQTVNQMLSTISLI